MWSINNTFSWRKRYRIYLWFLQYSLLPSSLYLMSNVPASHTWCPQVPCLASPHTRPDVPVPLLYTALSGLWRICQLIFVSPFLKVLLKRPASVDVVGSITFSFWLAKVASTFAVEAFHVHQVCPGRQIGCRHEKHASNIYISMCTVWYMYSAII